MLLYNNWVLLDQGHNKIFKRHANPIWLLILSLPCVRWHLATRCNLYMETGAISHMTSASGNLTSYSNMSIENGITLGNGTFVLICGLWNATYPLILLYTSTIMFFLLQNLLIIWILWENLLRIITWLLNLILLGYQWSIFRRGCISWGVRVEVLFFLSQLSSPIKSLLHQIS